MAEKCTRDFSLPRPAGNINLLWIHGASVGEAQSSLILIDHLLEAYPSLHIIVTTGTLTSAELMKDRLPDRAFHQFCPLDHPEFISKFLNHWRPDCAIWMESELWPNILNELKQRSIPAILVNAHMSSKSFKLWKRFTSFSRHILDTFEIILCQSDMDKQRFDLLGAKQSVVTDNIKYSAAPLTYSEDDLMLLRDILGERHICLYASTHEGEEVKTFNIHERLKQSLPNLLGIIVPRHPERRNEISRLSSKYALKTSFRGESKTPPKNDDDIYIVDTLGELGLFYALSPVAYIGRSLSNDGGGGHNPIEAAQLGCAVIHGSKIQNLQDIYDQMHSKKAALVAKDEAELEQIISALLTDQDKCASLQRSASAFAKEKSGVIKTIIKEISPYLDCI